MENQTPEKQSEVNHEQQKALTQRFSKLGFFARLETGFIDCETNGTLNMLSEGTLVSVIPAVKACYAMPSPYDEEDGTFAALIGLLYDVADDGIGLYFLSKTGYRWIIFDAGRYAHICEKWEFTPDEFRIYPQQSS